MNPRAYDLGKQGRLNFNRKLGLTISSNQTTLTAQDLLFATDYLLKVETGLKNIDDIDHLKNRRVRTSGELLQIQIGIGLVRLEKIIREKFSKINAQTRASDFLTSRPNNPKIKSSLLFAHPCATSGAGGPNPPYNFRGGKGVTSTPLHRAQRGEAKPYTLPYLPMQRINKGKEQGPQAIYLHSLYNKGAPTPTPQMVGKRSIYKGDIRGDKVGLPLSLTPPLVRSKGGLDGERGRFKEVHKLEAPAPAPKLALLTPSPLIPPYNFRGGKGGGEGLDPIPPYNFRGGLLRRVALSSGKHQCGERGKKQAKQPHFVCYTFSPIQSIVKGGCFQSARPPNPDTLCRKAKPPILCFFGGWGSILYRPSPKACAAYPFPPVGVALSPPFPYPPQQRSSISAPYACAATHIYGGALPRRGTPPKIIGGGKAAQAKSGKGGLGKRSSGKGVISLRGAPFGCAFHFPPIGGRRWWGPCPKRRKAPVGGEGNKERQKRGKGRCTAKRYNPSFKKGVASHQSLLFPFVPLACDYSFSSPRGATHPPLLRTSGGVKKISQATLGATKVPKPLNREITTLNNLINTKALNGALREFFGTSQLSQFMDQLNPLAEITHKRRLSSMGPGGVTRDSATLAIRGIHPTHYGRICPIETPEGKNTGLVNSLTTYARANSQGFLESPFYKVYKGQIQKNAGIFFLSAEQEEQIKLAAADVSSSLGRIGFLPKSKMPAKIAYGDTISKISRNIVEYIGVSPIQMISIATSLIPFLEHDDANRALMGSNMQRQAVPLIRAERPLVGTGLESRAVSDSGHAVIAKESGYVAYVSAKKIVIYTIPLYNCTPIPPIPA